MATLQFTVWEDANEVALGPVTQENIITLTGSSAQGAVITGSAGRWMRVRIQSDTLCWVTWGTSPTATTDGTSGRAIGIENPEYFAIKVGDRIAAITRT